MIFCEGWVLFDEDRGSFTMYKETLSVTFEGTLSRKRGGPFIDSRRRYVSLFLCFVLGMQRERRFVEVHFTCKCEEWYLKKHFF